MHLGEAGSNVGLSPPVRQIHGDSSSFFPRVIQPVMELFAPWDMNAYYELFLAIYIQLHIFTASFASYIIQGGNMTNFQGPFQLLLWFRFVIFIIWLL
jgi:hypothetical protein